MTTWSSEWFPAARDALVGLRGQGSTDGQGLPIPALSVIDATTVLGQITGAVLGRIRNNRPNGGAAVRAYYLTDNGTCSDSLTDFGVPRANSTISAEAYLGGFPGPDGTQVWLRSPTDYRLATDYSEYGDAASTAQQIDQLTTADAWAQALAGSPPTGHEHIYAPYVLAPTGDPVGDTASWMELHELVSAYQRACDAIAAGALAGTDMTAPMDVTSLAATWDAILAIGLSLDTLADVPPPAPLSDALNAASAATAKWLGEQAAAVANLAGNLTKNAAQGFGSGLGVYGVAAVVAAIAIFLAIR